MGRFNPYFEHTQDYFSSGTCKILMQGGKWVSDVPEDLRQKYEQPIAYKEPVKSPYPIPFRAKAPATPTGKPRLRVEMPMSAPPPPPKKAQPSRYQKVPAEKRVRPGSWNVLSDITVASIEALQDQGYTVKQIAAHYECSMACIFKRLRLSRRSSVEASRRDCSRRDCACGNRKVPHHEHCCICRRKLKITSQKLRKKR